MKYAHVCAAAGLALAATLPVAASAQQVAYTAKAVNLRAGPDRVYPIVAVLPPAASVVVQGCLSDYRWCDVSYGYDRGWVWAGNLRYPYTNGYVAFPGIAPVIGIAILAFVLDDYWSIHYHDRPFYSHRDRYPHVLPPPPRPRPPRPLPPPPGVRPLAPPAANVRPILPPQRAVPAPGVRPGVQPRVQPRAQPGVQPSVQPRVQPGVQPGARPPAAHVSPVAPAPRQQARPVPPTQARPGPQQQMRPARPEGPARGERPERRNVPDQP
jgi:uncharacterized protein YraI